MLGRDVVESLVTLIDSRSYNIRYSIIHQHSTHQSINLNPLPYCTLASCFTHISSSWRLDSLRSCTSDYRDVNASNNLICFPFLTCFKFLGKKILCILNSYDFPADRFIVCVCVFFKLFELLVPLNESRFF